MDQRQPGAMAAGISLFLIGAWLLAATLGASLAGLDQLWPAVLTLLGLTLLVQYLAARRSERGLAFLGLGAVLASLFLCAFTLRIGRLAWADMARWWPVIPILIGATFVGVYVLDEMADQTLLIPAYGLGGIGLLLLPLTLGLFPGPALTQIIRLSPLPVAVMLLALFFRPAAKGRG